ncbi:unnamed protein product [Ceratitis capitata]|uniref:(Mediterranean fruit fly) hypothetical protein n=1 Tax=Ceratitis capitata TaxID=7213 RepID=A0A811UHB6_CERCA|nr:unnamed protein product [Ceratitis capitata]
MFQCLIQTLFPARPVVSSSLKPFDSCIMPIVVVSPNVAAKRSTAMVPPFDYVNFLIQPLEWFSSPSLSRVQGAAVFAVFSICPIPSSSSLILAIVYSSSVHLRRSGKGHP